MRTLLKISSENNIEEKLPPAAFFELLKRSGAFDSRMTPRGSKFVKSLVEQAFGKTRQGADAAIMRGDNLEEYLEPETRNKKRMILKRLETRNDEDLMQIVRRDEKLGKLANRVLKN